MTSRTDVERELDRYLTEGAVHVPDRVVDVALGRIARTSQRHALRTPWRFNTMTSFLKPAIAGAAVMAALIFGGFLVTRPAVSPGVSPATSPPPSASSNVTDTSHWSAFTSTRYGYEISHPPTWTATAATTTWGDSREIDRANSPSTSWDHFRGEDALVYAYAADLPPGVSEDEWIVGQLEGCGPRFEDARPVVVDGHAGRVFLRLACQDAQAFVPIDGHMQVFVAWFPEPVTWPRETSIASLGQEVLLDSFLSTVHFRL